MEKLKPVTRTAKALAVATGVGLLASGDSGPVDNNQDTQSQALNARPGYVQAGESLGAMPLQEAVEKVLDATANKAEAQTPRRLFIPIIADPYINSSLLGSTPGPTPKPNPTETPVPRRTLEQYLQTAVENTASRLSKDGHDLKFLDDATARDKAGAVNDQALRDQVMTLLVQDMNDESGGTFDDLVNAGFESLASAPIELSFQPYNYVENGFSVPIGHFGAYEVVLNGRKTRVSGRVWAEVPQDPNEAAVYRTGQIVALSREIGCTSVSGYACSQWPATPSREQLDKMRDERIMLRNLIQVTT